jgi:hydroxypyruvate reductase
MNRPDSPAMQSLRAMARRIYDAALRSADPDPLVRRLLAVRGRTVLVDGMPLPLGEQGRVIILAAGKAAAAMAHAAEQQLDRLAIEGLVVLRETCGIPLSLPTLVAGHPLPDDRSVDAALRMLELAGGAVSGDLVLCLFSGGASALLTAPAPPLNLEHLRRTTGLLLRSGACIGRINCVRKHLSSIKGGLLARAAEPAARATLLLSDVVGDRPEVIASGPTVPDPSTFAQALEVLDRCGVREEVPRPVLNRLLAGSAGAIEETPGPGHPCFQHSITRVAGSNRTALEGAAVEARSLGCRVAIRKQPVTGEARTAAALVLSALKSRTAGSSSPPLCFISGGETTVILPERHGTGGRNMELALAAAPLLTKVPAAVLLSAGTDGSDGPTRAAGAIADSRTLQRSVLAGFDPQSALDSHDTFPLFHALEDLVFTGPTGTNVMDIQILLADHRE